MCARTIAFDIADPIFKLELKSYWRPGNIRGAGYA